MKNNLLEKTHHHFSYKKEYLYIPCYGDGNGGCYVENYEEGYCCGIAEESATVNGYSCGEKYTDHDENGLWIGIGSGVGSGIGSGFGCGESCGRGYVTGWGDGSGVWLGERVLSGVSQV